jgi:hypothetical protein
MLVSPLPCFLILVLLLVEYHYFLNKTLKLVWGFFIDEYDVSESATFPVR